MDCISLVGILLGVGFWKPNGRRPDARAVGSPSFFLSERGTRLTAGTVRRWFIIVSSQVGLRAPTDRRSPRIHDLRHRHAFKTILNWYRRGADGEAHVPELSPYMGHAHVTDTDWQISAAPERLKLATQRLEPQKGVSA